MEEEEVEKKGFFRRLGDIPCFRTAFLTGISSGLGVGFAYFMYSSHVKKSSNIGFGSYMVITFGSFCYCRYQWNQKLQQQALLRKAIQAKIIYEGTEKDIKEDEA